jgi:hypothetical protein
MAATLLRYLCSHGILTSTRSMSFVAFLSMLSPYLLKVGNFMLETSAAKACHSEKK